jgi:hypothetical protein
VRIVPTPLLLMKARDRSSSLKSPLIVIYLSSPFPLVFYSTKGLVIKLARVGGSSIGVVIDVLEFFAAIEIPLAEQ